MSREIYGVIYRVKNKINNKVYIGQTTVDFRKRYEMSRDKELSYGLYMYHLKHSKIKGDRHCNKHLLLAMKKYGWENFEVIEQIDVVYNHKYSQDELDCRECYWISYYDSFNNGYNNTIGGRGIGRINNQCIKVVLLNENKIFPSLKIASEYIGLDDYTSIWNCCNHRQIYAGKTKDGDFAVWCYYNEYINLTEKEIREKIKMSNNTRKNKKSNRLILCINNNKVYNSIRKCAKDLGVNHGRISECCKGDREFILVDNVEYRFKYMFNPPCLICITTKEMFNMVKDASEKYQCDARSITKCCKRKANYCGKLEDGTKLVWRRLNWNHNKKYRRVG